MRIEKIRINNYKVFETATTPKLGGLNVFTGLNGSGKSTFLDVLDFLRAAMTTTITAAVEQRGGLEQLLSKNSEQEDLEIELYITIKEETSSSYDQLIYLLRIGQEDHQVIVKKELLKQYSTLKASERTLLEVSDGFGKVANKKDGLIETILFELEDRDKLCIGIVGEVRGYPAVNVLRRLLSHWQLIDFQKEDNNHRTYLNQLTKTLHDQYPNTWELLLAKFKKAVPEIEQVAPIKAADGRIILQFTDGSFKDPFTTGYMADGVLKLWAYLLVLHHPNPIPLLGIESPEHNLHASLLDDLVEEFRAYANRGGQLLITSYSSTLMDALRLEELFGMRKEAGKATIQAAKDDFLVQKGYEVGESLGSLWQ